jgi:predicted N-acetyltransferase YhbS
MHFNRISGIYRNWRIIVDGKYGGSKIGRSLVEEVIKWARLPSDLIKKGAHLCYRRIGFSEIKEQKVFAFDLTK